MSTVRADGPGPAVDPAAVVLRVVRRLVGELQPRRTAPVSLDSDLERDLGLDSLAVAELLARIEDAVGTPLPSALLRSAATPRDLLAAVSLGEGIVEEEDATGGATPDAATDALVTPPAGELSTLLESLDWHVAAHPDRVHARMLHEGRQATTLTYRQLRVRAEQIAAGLQGRDVVAGDAVALMLPTSADYFGVFVAIWLAGAVAVPIYPPDRPDRLREHLQRQARILRSAQASVLVTVADAVGVARLVRAEVESLRHICTVEQLTADGVQDVLAPTARSSTGPDRLAVLQYTSGSTGDPKGVMLRHADLVANIDAMADAIRATPADVFVSWLPLYHDMGLIGCWMGSLHVGMTLVVMPPQDFIVRPARWLQAISDYGGTLAAAPNFAYELCLKRIDDSQVEALDLHTWRYAFNGAEAVRPSTLRRFADRFAPAGLQPEALAPCYGLAEAALGLAFPPPGRGPVIDRIRRDTLREDGVAVPAGPQDDAVELAACGQIIGGYEVRVVDDRGRVLPARHEGHLQFRGPSATSGYVRNPQATAALRDGDWVRTGDLAYLAEGDIVITGRSKDLIIRAGHNLHPQELEERIGGVEGIRAGCVVAVGVPDEATGTERLVVIAETRATAADERERIRSAALEAAVSVVASPPDELVLVEPGRIPKTSSGKLRRVEARARYLDGRLRRRPPPVWAQIGSMAAHAGAAEVQRLVRHRRADVQALWARTVGWLLGVTLAVIAAVVPRLRWRAAIARPVGRVAARLAGCRVEVSGSPLPAGGVVVVANHASWLDGLVLAVALPGTPRFLAAEALARVPLQGFVLRRFGAVFIERHDRQQGVTDIAALSDVIGRDQTLVAFPEGRLDGLPGLRPFHLGAFRYAAEAGVPVVPIAITGTRQMLPPGSHRLRPGTARIAVGTPVHPTGGTWPDLLTLRDAARQHIARHCGEFDRG